MQSGGVCDDNRVSQAHLPLATTTAITPALRIRVLPGPVSSTACISPMAIPSSLKQGLRKPVISISASPPRRCRVPADNPNRSIPVVVTFSPICAGATSKPFAARSSNSSAWIR